MTASSGVSRHDIIDLQLENGRFPHPDISPAHHCVAGFEVGVFTQTVTMGGVACPLLVGSSKVRF